jgi:hypothetical protein
MKLLKAAAAMLAVILFTVMQGYSQTRRPQQNSIISTKVIVLKYRHTDSSSMPDHNDTLKIPVVSDKYPELKEALSFKKIVDADGPDSLLKNYANCGCGLTGMDYEVTFESKDIISLRIYGETMGAYPDSYTQWLTLNVHTGKAYTIDQELDRLALKWIYNSYIKLMNKRIGEDKYKNSVNKEMDDSAYNDTYKDIYQSIDTLTSGEMLRNYVFTNDGIVFETEPVLPHVVHALEPQRDWFVPYKKLKRYRKGQALVIK